MPTDASNSSPARAHGARFRLWKFYTVHAIPLALLPRRAQEPSIAPLLKEQRVAPRILERAAILHGSLMPTPVPRLAARDALLQVGELLDFLCTLLLFLIRGDLAAQIRQPVLRIGYLLRLLGLLVVDDRTCEIADTCKEQIVPLLDMAGSVDEIIADADGMIERGKDDMSDFQHTNKAERSLPVSPFSKKNNTGLDDALLLAGRTPADNIRRIRQRDEGVPIDAAHDVLHLVDLEARHGRV